MLLESPAPVETGALKPAETGPLRPADTGPLRPADTGPLRPAEVDDPVIAPDEVLVEVSVCGVCRTDLHIVEADIDVPTLPLVPGHQIVGRVKEAGTAVTRLRLGDRVGISWVNRMCGQCGPCVQGRENLCSAPVFTGYHRHGGYATLAAVPAAFAHPIPEQLGDDAHVAPLLCAGIIGYRALKQSGLRPGSPLALYGFGASAHIALQIAVAWGCEVFVASRTEDALIRARAMGASWTGQAGDVPEECVDHAISFAPAGWLIPGAMEALRPGGTLALAGIYTDRVPELDYDRHLFREKSIVSVTANTRSDAAELLNLAARIPLRTDIETYPLTEANTALANLKSNRLGAQAAVLTVAAG
ncbi:MAG: zinc-binding alcohol dehydrogenase family protein [Anaerolineae bacterium]